MKTMLNRKVIVRTFLAIITAVLLIQATAQTEIKERSIRGKVYICHFGKMMVIDRISWPAHKAHGDKMGPCEEEPPINPGQPDE